MDFKQACKDYWGAKTITERRKAGEKIDEALSLLALEEAERLFQEAKNEFFFGGGYDEVCGLIS